MYTQLGHYVEVACGNEQATFSTSGFVAVIKTKTAPTPLSEVNFSFIDRGPNSGQVVVKPQSQKTDECVTDCGISLAPGLTPTMLDIGHGQDPELTTMIERRHNVGHEDLYRTGFGP